MARAEKIDPQAEFGGFKTPPATRQFDWVGVFVIGSPNKVGWSIDNVSFKNSSSFLAVVECSDFDAVFFKRSAILELCVGRAKPEFAEMVLGVQMLILGFSAHFRHVRKVPARRSRSC